MKDEVLVLVGPTAVGKTKLSIALAKEFNGEIISADSRQVYRGLDIGSGKITRTEMDGIPHHLLDVADPKEVFSVADYVRLGRAAIADILNRKKLPLVVGGTGFYVDALLGNISIPEVPADETLRAELRGQSLEELNTKLQKLDPEKAKTIDTKNPVRIVRAIEIATALGTVPPSQSEKLYRVAHIGLTLPQEKLQERIHARLLARMEAGMLEEAVRLHAEGLSWERMEELGLEYRSMARHLQGKISYEEMLAELESEIRHYAKRQTTWFKRNKDIRWFAPEETASIMEAIKIFLAENDQGKTL